LKHCYILSFFKEFCNLRYCKITSDQSIPISIVFWDYARYLQKTC